MNAQKTTKTKRNHVNFVWYIFHAGLASSTTEFTITGKFPAAYYAYFTCSVDEHKYVVKIHCALVQHFAFFRFATFDVDNFFCSFNFDCL